jgi:hypothetical protein
MSLGEFLERVDESDCLGPNPFVQRKVRHAEEIIDGRLVAPLFEHVADGDRESTEADLLFERAARRFIRQSIQSVGDNGGIDEVG